MSSRPANVGILAMEMYSPKRFVSQEGLEEMDNCKGKYTIGLGQSKMAFTDDREDIASFFMTATKLLVEKNNIDVSRIGRIEVGTETIIDKSKSVKTSLIGILGDKLSSDLEGVTNINACYGGTAALLNSIAWIESSDWDGRYALVVCGDIAVYEAGPARPTGGGGAIAMLLGPDAPLVLEPGVRASHVLDVYDFYKPTHSEYAMVDGRLSQFAYLSSVDSCYRRYKEKFAAKHPGHPSVDVDHFDFFAFHSPYNKLVQKGFSRLLFCDYLDLATPSSSSSSSSSTSSSSTSTVASELSGLSPEYASVPLADTYESKDIETVFRTASDSRFKAKVMPCCALNTNIGNCYTGSVFSSLLSVVCLQGDALVGKRIMMFSYGSGSVATLYSLVGRVPSDPTSPFSLGATKTASDMINRLALRTASSVSDFVAALDLRAAKYGKAPMVPEGDVSHLFPGTYFLTGINEKHHRTYDRVPL